MEQVTKEVLLSPTEHTISYIPWFLIAAKYVAVMADVSYSNLTIV